MPFSRGPTSPESPALAGEIFTTSTTQEVCLRVVLFHLETFQYLSLKIHSFIIQHSNVSHIQSKTQSVFKLPEFCQKYFQLFCSQNKSLCVSDFVSKLSPVFCETLLFLYLGKHQNITNIVPPEIYKQHPSLQLSPLRIITLLDGEVN